MCGQISCKMLLAAFRWICRFEEMMAMGYKISWPTEKCRLCGRVWILARGQKIGLGKLGYACPHCSDKIGERRRKCRKVN